MTNADILTWGWLLSIVTAASLGLARGDIWWRWHVIFGLNLVWVAYAFETRQFGFLLGIFLVLMVCAKKAYILTKEHRRRKLRERWLAKWNSGDIHFLEEEP